MSREERTTFIWKPEAPSTGFNFEVITTDPLPSRHFVYGATVTDANGEEIRPASSDWSFSQSLGVYFKYSPGGDTETDLSWQSGTYFTEARIDIIRWASDAVLTEIIGAAFAPHTSNSTTQVWTVLQPSEASVA